MPLPDPDQPPRRRPALTADETTLHLIASGLVILAQTTLDGEPIRVPYPLSLQRGLDRLVALCLQRQVPPPQGVPDLIDWCRRPLAEWPLDLPDAALGQRDRLLDESTITSVCDAWACASPDVEAEISEQQLIRSVFEVCRAANKPETYVAFRRLLIERPVLTALELQQACVELALSRLADQIREGYSLAPAAWAIDGAYHCCGQCGNLLQPTDRGGWRCENERCNRAARPKPARTVDASEEIVWLKRGLRRFVAAPGLVELRLAERLIELGVDVELWPAFDRYDLRIVFEGGEAWAVDVKDWANPFLLARQIEPIPTEPPWSRAFFVFPNERLAERRDYLRAFNNAGPVLGPNTSTISERSLIDQVRRKLERGKEQ